MTMVAGKVAHIVSSHLMGAGFLSLAFSNVANAASSGDALLAVELGVSTALIAVVAIRQVRRSILDADRAQIEREFGASSSLLGHHVPL